jgi:sugar/nucleoside kinase (ribokinase family)
MGSLGVIGNISRDLAIYPNGAHFEMVGGAALHIALAAARVGLPASPVSVIGTDLGWITADPRLTGVDMRHVKVQPGDSCAFRFTYDRDGRVASTEMDFGVAADLTGHALSVLGLYRACHVCCRRPLSTAAVLRRLIAQGISFSVDFHVASASILMLAARTALPHASGVFVNTAEFAILTELVDPGRLNTIVISDGPRPAIVLRRGHQVALAVPPSATVSEVTGAGDTLTGTFLAASARGLGCSDALREAVNAASHAVTRPGLAIPSPGA